MHVYPHVLCAVVRLMKRGLSSSPGCRLGRKSRAAVLSIRTIRGGQDRLALNVHANVKDER